MAQKLVFFTSKDKCVKEELIDYTYFSGFAVSQKQKSIRSLHEAISQKYPGSQILEISTKSENPLGVQLSAFNLMFFHEELQEFRHIENVFQSSKVFENGGPYRDLLNVPPKDAKRDQRLVTSGRLMGFSLYDELWPLEPKTMFYDWIYINALIQNKELAEKITNYQVFTDIEFNHKKSINCQARAAAIYAGLVETGRLEEALSSKEKFAKTYYSNNDGEQVSLF